MKRHYYGSFEKRYIPTIGVEVRRLKFDTNYGVWVLNCWDTAGQEKFGGLREGYYIDGDAAIIMFDVTARVTYRNVPTWHKDLTRVCSNNIPIVLCGNKVDVKDRQVKPREITFHRRNQIQYYDISAKCNFNYELPFLYLIRRLIDRGDCEFKAGVAVLPADAEIDQAQYERELQEAQNTEFTADADDI